MSLVPISPRVSKPKKRTISVMFSASAWVIVFKLLMEKETW